MDSFLKITCLSLIPCRNYAPRASSPRLRAHAVPVCKGQASDPSIEQQRLRDEAHLVKSAPAYHSIHSQRCHPRPRISLSYVFTEVHHTKRYTWNCAIAADNMIATISAIRI